MPFAAAAAAVVVVVAAVTSSEASQMAHGRHAGSLHVSISPSFLHQEGQAVSPTVTGLAVVVVAAAAAAIESAHAAQSAQRPSAHVCSEHQSSQLVLLS